MKADFNLQAVLNEVAALVRSGVVRPCPNAAPLDEFAAFVALDPLLSELRKQYLDAKSHHAQSLREHGPHDAMTDMAAWMEDSAWCAVQARYMELRADSGLMKRAQKMVLESEHAARQADEDENRNHVQMLAEQMALYRKMRPEQKDDGLFLWVLVLMANGPQNTFSDFYTAPAFNRLAA